MVEQTKNKSSATKKATKPSAEFEVEHVYGYRIHDCQQNL
jgi:hypothetical protein